MEIIHDVILREKYIHVVILFCTMYAQKCDWKETHQIVKSVYLQIMIEYYIIFHTILYCAAIFVMHVESLSLGAILFHAIDLSQEQFCPPRDISNIWRRF